jgi:hypothetical protein
VGDDVRDRSLPEEPETLGCAERGEQLAVGHSGATTTRR